MRYKLLIHGKKQALIRDFMQHTSAAFMSLTTSELWEDVENHFDVLRPDAFMFFYDDGNDNIPKLAQAVSNEHNIPIIVVSSEACMEDFERNAPTVSALKITGYDDIKELKDKIGEYIERRKVASPISAAAASTAAAVSTAAGSSVSDLIKSFEKLQSKKQLLVVDDDRTVLKMLKTVLSDDYEVTTIAGGKMAEKFLETRSADLILLDYEMPDESGPDVFANIKANKKTADIPVVFLTGVSDGAKIKEVMSLGPRGYLLKPINVERLTATIKDILQQ